MKEPPTIRRPQRRIAVALTRSALCFFAFSALLGACAVCWVSWQVQRTSAENDLLREARVCTERLQGGSVLDWGTTVARLQRDYPRLEGIAEVGPDGAVERVHPPTRPLESAIHSILLERAKTPGIKGDNVVPTSITRNPGAPPFWGVVLPDDAATDGGQQATLVLFAKPKGFAVFTGSAAWGAVLVLAANLLGVALLRTWFDRRVGKALQSISRATCINGRDGEHVTDFDSDGWAELESIRGAVGELRRRFIESEGRRMRVVHAAEERARDHQIGLDCKLRLAQDQAHTDSLTGLRNRAFLEANLERVFEHHRARDEDLSLIMIDVDNFKIHNDTLGHAAGDSALRFIGELLRGVTRSGDHAVRYGGDEFLLILPKTASKDAEAIAKRVVTLFHRHAQTVEGDVKMALSAGVASLKQGASSNGHVLLDRADRALYKVKRGGKNGVAAHAGV